MFCQECGREEASVHITRIVNGKKTELNLCRRCARNAEELKELDFSFEPQFKLHSLFGGLLNENVCGSREGSRASKVQCPSCALTFAQFSQIGRLGCSECLAAFEENLQPLLRRIHGSCKHNGKVPRRSEAAVKFKRELERLKDELRQKVQKEEFEDAALLRDRIRTLEQELQKGSHSRKDSGEDPGENRQEGKQQ